MKLLYITTISATLNSFFIKHIEALINAGFKVDIASSEMDTISDEFKKMNVNIHDLSLSRSPFNKGNFLAYKQIKELCDKNRYDIVHVHTPIAAFITRLAVKNNGCKVIYTAHGFHFYKGAPILNWLIYYPAERLASRWTDKIATMNNEDFKRAKDFKLRKNGTVVLTNGVGVEPEILENPDMIRMKKREEIGIREDEFMLLVLAEFNQNKNHKQIINAIKDLDSKYDKIKLVCAGDGVLEDETRKYVKDHNLEDKIKIIGWRSDVRELIEASDAVGLFSYREGLPKCIMEAMIYKRPLIVTASRGASALVDDGENGFVVEIDNVKQTKERLIRIYEDKELRDTFIKAAFEKSERYVMKNVVKEVVELNKF